MNRGHVLQSSSPYVQHMMGGGSPNLWTINNMRPSSQPTSSSFLAPPPPLPPNLFPQFLIPPPPPPPPPSSTRSPPSPWSDAQELPESWSQLLLGGLVGEDKSSSLSNMQMAKKLENWEENLLQQNQTSSGDVVKQEDPLNTYANMYATTHHHHHGNNAELFQTTSSLKPPWSQMIPVSSPTSCVTTLSSTSNMLDFSSKNDPRHPPPTHSSECNSTATGGVVKKARVQPTTSTQSTFKVRKEKLGDRITALHQIVSPFGKTDTASVLLEAIGYIRFLHNQIEALSLPYLDSGSGNMRQQHVQGDRNCLFPEDPGQLLNDGCNKMKGISDKESDEEAKRDLWSRGLCLVPISCTMQVGSDNGADYWAPAAFNGGFR